MPQEGRREDQATRRKPLKDTGQRHQDRRREDGARHEESGLKTGYATEKRRQDGLCTKTLPRIPQGREEKAPRQSATE